MVDHIVGAVAHQDDDPLLLGAMFQEHLKAGKECHVLVLTDGTGSAVQAQLGMSDEEFTWHRDDELKRAARAMGIPFENVHIPVDRPGGGELTPDAADSMIMEYLLDFPGASVKTHSYREWPGHHSDHAAAGKGLQQIHQRGETSDPRYYVPPWEPALSNFLIAFPMVRLSVQRTSSDRVTRILDAFDAYADVDPLGRKLGIGRRSVAYFDQLRDDPRNYWHLP